HSTCHPFPTRRTSDLYAMTPSTWKESAEALDAAGHIQVELSENPDFVFFSGKQPDFPEDLPESVKFIQEVRLLAAKENKVGIFRSEEHTSELQSRFDL